ncbi:hypothetical protein FACS1894211_02160 [Clostridia bacterium]|nr:hypothetical protein FACS1894211_02160 [Clostridia bacterium]
MKYDLIIFDVGRTLYDKRTMQVAPASIVADIVSLRKGGIKVGVCSMRTQKHCQAVVGTPLDFYICLNGSYVVCDNTLVYDSPINNAISVKDMLTYGSGTAYYSSQEARRKGEENGFLVEEYGIANKPYSIIMFNIEPNSLTIYDKYHYEYWENTKTIALQNKEDSRVLAINKVLDYYKLGSKILYFGDGPNDIEVFKNFHDCVCMGDCYPELEKYALFKTLSCQEHGVSMALRKIGLLSHNPRS